MSVGWDLATALDKNFSKQGAPRRAGIRAVLLSSARRQSVWGVFCLGPRP